GGRTTGRLVLRTLAGWVLACVALAVLCSSALAATGTIEGTVTDASSATHAPLENVDIIVFDSSDDFVTAACTQADGTYQATDLAPGTYRVGFGTADGICGPNLNLLPQYYNNKPSLATATPVSVASGGTTSNIDAAMQPGGQITGTVTDNSTHAVQGDVEVDLSDARGSQLNDGCTGAEGTYSFAGLTTGSYRVGFAASSDFCGVDTNYLPQFYNGKSSLAAADPVSVTAGSTTSNINAALQQGGQITGTVTDASTHNPVAGVVVEVLDASGDFVNSICTAGDGTYTVHGLQTAAYAVQFSSSSDNCARSLNYVTQFYNGKSSQAAADSVAVTAGATAPNINAALQPGGQISGTVTDASTHAPLQN